MIRRDAVRRALAVQLAERCNRHHLVVWDDPALQYEAIVESVIPEGWGLERYDGSWWDLRRRIEIPFSGAGPPKIVLYIPARPLVADPLEEVRQAAGSYKRLLPTLLRDALAQDLGTARVAELADKCATLVAVEEALAGGDRIDPLLVAATGAHGAEAVLAALLVGDHRTAVGNDQLVPSFLSLSRGHLGVSMPAAGDGADDEEGSVDAIGPDLGQVRTAIAQHLVVAEIARSAGDEVARVLIADWSALTVPHSRNTAGMIDRLIRPATLDAWGALSDEASSSLRLRDIGWTEGLATCDVSRCLDDMAFAEAARRLADDPSGARSLVAGRIESSRWLRWRDDWSARALADLAAVRSVASLRLSIEANPIPEFASLGAVYQWYADGAWTVDRSHRLMEGARFGLGRPGLDRAFTEARESYLEWLDRLLVQTNVAARTSTAMALPRQCDIYKRYVSADGPVVLIIADAMRLEIGHRLSALLNDVATACSVVACVAAVPTITRVGMANLLPGAADEGLGIRLEANQIVVEVGGPPVRTVADRTAAYRTAAGRVEDHQLSEWSSLGDDVLAQRVAAADLLVVRSQEIDAAGEAGLAAVRWSQIDAAVDTIAILISRLAGAGVTKVVVTADHGFLALGRPLDPSRTRREPTGNGVVEHGRAWVGSPSRVGEGCTVLPLSEFSIRGSESIVVTDGMTVFGSAGGGFFHGGISPQEALVPVVQVDMVAPRQSGDYTSVEVSMPVRRISAEVFSARVTLAGSLFASEMTVRVTACDSSGTAVARLVPNQSVDPETGVIRLQATIDANLSFLVSRNLDKGSTVAIVVRDAATGRPLAEVEATVAKELRPEESW